MRLVFLNALPLNAFGERFLARVRRVGIDYVKQLVRIADDVVSYIRHPSTVELLNSALGLDLEVCSGLYKYRKGDVVVVVTLKKPIRGKEVSATINDLEFYIVELDDVFEQT